MKFFRNFAIAFCFVLGLGMNVGFAEEAAPKAGCETPSAPYSLHSALDSAQNASNRGKDVVIPRGLPGSTQSEDLDGEEAALQGFAGLLQRITNGLTAVAAAIAVFFIVFSGGGMMLAAGDTEAIKKARKGIMWALLGLLLIMGAYIIAKTAISLTYSGSDFGQNALNLNCIEEPVETPEEPTVCEDRPSLPESCYEDGYGSSGIGGVGTGQACDDSLEASDDFKTAAEFIGAAPNIKAVQAALEAQGAYTCPVPTGRTDHADGQFGRCTQEALNFLIEKKCSEQAAGDSA